MLCSVCSATHAVEMANRRSGAGPLTWRRPVRMFSRPTRLGGRDGALLQLSLQALERRQALLERRVVGEQVHQRALGARGDDEEGARAFDAAQILAGGPFDRAA